MNRAETAKKIVVTPKKPIVENGADPEIEQAAAD